MIRPPPGLSTKIHGEVGNRSARLTGSKQSTTTRNHGVLPISGYPVIPRVLGQQDSERWTGTALSRHDITFESIHFPFDGPHSTAAAIAPEELPQVGIQR